MIKKVKRIRSLSLFENKERVSTRQDIVNMFIFEKYRWINKVNFAPKKLYSFELALKSGMGSRAGAEWERIRFSKMEKSGNEAK